MNGSISQKALLYRVYVHLFLGLKKCELHHCSVDSKQRGDEKKHIRPLLLGLFICLHIFNDRSNKIVMEARNLREREQEKDEETNTCSNSLLMVYLNTLSYIYIVVYIIYAWIYVYCFNHLHFRFFFSRKEEKTVHLFTLHWISIYHTVENRCGSSCKLFLKTNWLLC